jgi:hypothetical protein
MDQKLSQHRNLICYGRVRTLDFVQAVPDVDIVQHCARRIHLDTDAGVGEYNAVGYNMVVPVDLSVHVQRSTKKKRPSFQCVFFSLKMIH